MVPRLPLEREAGLFEPRVSLSIRTGGHDVVTDLLPGLLAAGLAGIGRLKAHFLHLGRPPAIVVAARGRMPPGLLPRMTRLMQEHAQNVFVRLASKLSGVRA